MGLMPFRIQVSLALLALLLVSALVVPLVIPIRPLKDVRPAAELAAPGSRFVAVDGLRVHLVTAGPPPADGTPAFVLLHGFGASTYSWHAVMDALGRYGTVVAFDRPGFGLTDRPLHGAWGDRPNPYGPEGQVAVTVGLMDALGLQRAILVGHSAGGTVALETALAHPDRVAGLVLADPAVYARAGAPGWARWLLDLPQVNRLGPLIMRQLAGPNGETFIRNAWAHPDRVDDATIAAYRKPLQVEHWDEALWAYTKAQRAPALEGRLAGLAVPTLVLTGADDPVVPPADAERLAAALPDAQLRSLADCGHVPQEECPAAFLDAVAPWLRAQGVAPSAGDGAPPTTRASR